MSIQALRLKRVEIANKMKAHVDQEGAWTSDRQAVFENMQAEIAQIDNQIKAIEASLQVQEGLAAADEQTARFRNVSIENAGELRREMLVAFLRDGQQGIQNLIQQGRIQNAQSVGSGAGGGYTVTREMFSSIQQAMRAIGGVRDLATVIQTAGGNPLDFVVTDATAEEGAMLGENQQTTAADTSFGNASIAAYKYTSNSIAISMELMQDSEFDIEAYVVELLGLRLGRITNRHFTVGNGTTQPQGVVTAASVGIAAATGNATGITLDNLVALEHSIDPVYRAAARWMFHDNTLLKLKQLKDSTGRPLWLPGVAVGAPDTILSYGYQINQHMPVMAANAKSVLFGDFKKYLIRDVMGAVLYRNTDSKYNEQGQVGFHSLMRTGGGMVDIGGAIKAYQNSAT